MHLIVVHSSSINLPPGCRDLFLQALILFNQKTTAINEAELEVLWALFCHKKQYDSSKTWTYKPELKYGPLPTRHCPCFSQRKSCIHSRSYLSFYRPASTKLCTVYTNWLDNTCTHALRESDRQRTWCRVNLSSLMLLLKWKLSFFWQPLKLKSSINL